MLGVNYGENMMVTLMKTKISGSSWTTQCMCLMRLFFGNTATCQNSVLFISDKFFQRISQYFNSDNPAMVFTEDLKHVAYLCEDKDSDIELVVKMMKRQATSIF